MINGYLINHYYIIELFNDLIGKNRFPQSSVPSKIYSCICPWFFFFLYKRKSSLIWQFILHVITYFLKESVSKVNRTVMAFNSPLTRAFKINFVYACLTMNVWDLFCFPLFTSCSFLYVLYHKRFKPCQNQLCTGWH